MDSANRYTALGANTSPHLYPATDNQWMEKPRSKSQRAKWIVSRTQPLCQQLPNNRLPYKTVGLGALLIVLIATGVAVGVVLSRKNSNLNTNARPAATNTSAPGSGSVNQTDPNDPSTFQADPRLKRSFYGFAYAPTGVQLPDCGAKLCKSRSALVTVHHLDLSSSRGYHRHPGRILFRLWSMILTFLLYTQLLSQLTNVCQTAFVVLRS